MDFINVLFSLVVYQINMYKLRTMLLIAFEARIVNDMDHIKLLPPTCFLRLQKSTNLYLQVRVDHVINIDRCFNYIAVCPRNPFLINFQTDLGIMFVALFFSLCHPP